MPETGKLPNPSLASLAERMKQKTEAERLATEEILEKTLKTLSENAHASMKNVLSTMENAMAQEIKTAQEKTRFQIKMLNSGFIKHWLICALLGLGLCLGLSLGGWGLMKLAQGRISNIAQEISSLSQQKTSLEITVTQLESQTWGLTLSETPEGRFIVLPPKATAKAGWKIGNRQAVKLE